MDNLKEYARVELRKFSADMSAQMLTVDQQSAEALREILHSYAQYRRAVDEYLDGEDNETKEQAAAELSAGFHDRITPVEEEDDDTMTRNVGELRASWQGVVTAK